MTTDEVIDRAAHPSSAAWPESVGGPWSAIARTTLLDFLAPRLTAGGDRPAVIFDDDVELTCRQLKERIESVAGALSDRVLPGDRVVLAVGNRAEFLVAYFAIVANRGVVVTLNPAIQTHDAAHVLSDSGAVLAIAEAQPAEVLRAAAPATLADVLVVEEPEPDGLALYTAGTRPMSLESVRGDIDDLTDIGYTSGTTGLPKALAGDHGELLRYADVFLRTTPVGTGDRVLCPLQFHYGDPLWLLLASTVFGEPMIVMRRFSVSRFWDVARRHSATAILTIGSIPNLLLTPAPSPSERDHGVRLAIAVGVPRHQHAELVERFGFPWLEFYGSSESGPAISMPAGVAAQYVGTGALGIPVPEVCARLVDPDGNELHGEALGELELSGMILFEEYLDNPQATAEVTHDGWLRSGDLMRRDAHGMYYFEGRRKELIRRGGENIAPAEVEAILRLHPAVIDAAVVPVEDELWGEEVKAYVEVKSSTTAAPSDLAAFCAQRLAPFKVPRYIEVRTEPFQRTPSQRIPKAVLKVDGVHQTTTAWDREDDR
jgi:crotonobetaine/carnitine-CoA ligase